MNEQIKSRMEEGERLLWQGGPEDFRALDKTNKKRFWITTAVCILTAIALLLLYIFNVKDGVKPSIIVIILFLCAFAPLRQLLNASAVRKLRYVVTDRQLMVVSSEVKGVSLSRVKEAALRTDEDGHLSLLVGADSLKSKPNHWRDDALTGQPSTAEPGSPVERFVFYAVADKAGLKKVIRQVLPFVQI